MHLHLPSVAVFAALGVAVSANAATIGAGVGTLTLAGANNAVDTPSNGSNDQSRQNLDQSFFVSLPAGVYSATTWQFNAGQAGSVTPYLAVLTGADAYQIIAVGDAQVITGGFGVDTTVAFGGSNTFTLNAATDVYAGIVNPKEVGSQNPIQTNLNSGSFMDHDNNNDGLMSPAVLGGAVDGFGHTNLPRSYAFSINVDLIPEPSSALFMVVGLASTLLIGSRRRR
ncbi:MAG: hypothetical protein ACKV19_24135 [Verrucomicrobiales bacterium]